MMSKPLVRSAVLVEQEADGSQVITQVYKDKGKRRGSKRLRPLEKAMRRIGEATSTASDVYLDRHARSNRKKKNGWAKDLGKNIRKAQRRGVKKLKISWI
jgi:hypothetical protein